MIRRLFSPGLGPCSVALAVILGTACSRGTASEDAAGEAGDRAGSAAAKLVDYDVWRLRPKDGVPLSKQFDGAVERARGEGKTVAVLFSADWCEPCKRLSVELGNRHPAEAIAHVRILELKEEDWEQVTRMNEFNDLRRRWYPILRSYPVLVVLDDAGEKVEEMKEAIARLEGLGLEPTLSRWFETLRTG